jgi:hypothetical protein
MLTKTVKTLVLIIIVRVEDVSTQAGVVEEDLGFSRCFIY